MSNKFRTALIGCGRKARDHANTISKHELLDFTACCDIREEAAAGMAEQFDVASHYTDYEELFSSEAIQLAVISTQAGQHHELTLAAADYARFVNPALRVRVDGYGGDPVVRPPREGGPGVPPREPGSAAGSGGGQT